MRACRPLDSTSKGTAAGLRDLSMANYKFAINPITKRLLQQLLTWEDANVKSCGKISQTTV
jgi:hypothetical protein